MREEALDLLEKLTQAHGVPGHEGEVRAIFTRELAGLGTFSTDRSGSVFCESAGQGPRVLLAGHMDEIGFMVQQITPEGFLQIVALGGWWEHSLLAQRVEVLTRSGRKIQGVVASRPPHLLPEAQRRQVMGMEQLYVDVGADSRAMATAEFGIALGDPIAPIGPFSALARKGLYMAKAFDNRAGMAATIQAGRILLRETLPNRTILAGTVQEEVGLRGARTAAVHAKPDVAIVMEGPPADDAPGMARSECQGRLGGGVQIRLFDPTAITNPRLGALAIEVAQQQGIAHQVTVRRSGGTDAGSFHLAGEGVPTIVLGVPARYIHSHQSILDIEDQLAAVQLACALVRRLDAQTVDGLTRYL